MNSTACARCCTAIRQNMQTPGHSLTSRAISVFKSGKLDIPALLSKPTWSVRSLLPPLLHSSSPSPSPSSPPSEAEEVTPKTLHHLLRLSALPPPSSSAEEKRMLATLSSQLHFVRAIQRVDTANVQPLRAIRDETAAGLREQTIGLETLRDALAGEYVVGHARRPRRRRGEKVDAHDVEDWDVLGGAGLTAGRYFVVRSGNARQEASTSLSSQSVTAFS